MEEIRKVKSSFRDPSGFVFYRNGELYRQVNSFYKEDYDYLIQSGLYKTLADSGLLISHSETNIDSEVSHNAYKILKPEFIGFISYPYEWCFSELKDAALLTIQIQKIALEFGMTLKDSSAYNVQFKNGKPIFIDTLSFEKYTDGKIWKPYRQFCQHFLAPLALMSYKDIRLNQLLRVYIDGLPLDLVSAILPIKTWVKFSLLSHVHLHSKSQKHFGKKPVASQDRKLSKNALLGLIDSLQSTIKNTKWKPAGTDWLQYYESTNYSDEALSHKKTVVLNFLEKVKPKVVWDMGANTGLFSSLASKQGSRVISFDIDPAAVELSYINYKNNNETRILPLVMDLTNPSPAIGWENQERVTLFERGSPDTVLALALLHHLAIANNLPLEGIAGFFRKITRSLIVEFIPKADSQVKRLLSSRDDIFSNYTQAHFESSFSKFFKIIDSINIKGTHRTVYLMEKR